MNPNDLQTSRYFYDIVILFPLSSLWETAVFLLKIVAEWEAEQFDTCGLSSSATGFSVKHIEVQLLNIIDKYRYLHIITLKKSLEE